MGLVSYYKSWVFSYYWVQRVNTRVKEIDTFQNVKDLAINELPLIDKEFVFVGNTAKSLSLPWIKSTLLISENKQRI